MGVGVAVGADVGSAVGVGTLAVVGAGVNVAVAVASVVGVGMGSPQAIARTANQTRTPRSFQYLLIVMSSLVEIAELWTVPTDQDGQGGDFVPRHSARRQVRLWNAR